MSKKTLRILYFFVIPVVALFGGFHVSDTYLGNLHFGNEPLGIVCLILAAIAFFVPIAIYFGRKKV